MSIDKLAPMRQLSEIGSAQVMVDVTELELNIGFEQNSSQQDGIIWEVYERPGKEYLQDSPELQSQVNSKKLIQRYLPKPADLDKMLKIIHRIILKGNHLPVTVKKIQASCLNSPYYKGVSLYHTKLL